MRKLFRLSRSRGATGRLKVIFHEFPGGAEVFELISRYCYNRGSNILNITLSNSLPLILAAVFMEIMNQEDNINIDKGRLCLINQTREIFLKEIHLCPWSEFVDSLKCFQEFLPLIMNSPMSSMFHEQLLDCLVGRLSWPYLCNCNCNNSSSSSSSSSSSTSYGDIISTGRSSNYSSPSGSKWWFRDLDFLNLELFDKVVKTMINAQKIDSFVICSFLFHYQKFKFRGSPTPSSLTDDQFQKCKIIETLINLLYLLTMNNNRSSFTNIPLRGLFHILQLSMSLESVLKSHIQERLEFLIASLLDQATIDDLLFPSPLGEPYAYDVNLILRLQKQFLFQVGSSNNYFQMQRVKKVAVLMDYYISEVAPDPQLTPSKFVALITTLPESARDSHDMIYEAMGVYFKVYIYMFKLCKDA